MTAASATALISCPDQKGIVAEIALFIRDHGGNILDADQHSDAAVGQFFMRVVFDLAGMSLPATALQATMTEALRRFSARVEVRLSTDVKRAAILVSKQDHCFYDLLLRHRAGELNCQIPLIISNHPDLEEPARHFGIPYLHVPVAKDNKTAAEDSILAELARADVHLVVLARYMQILSSRFCAAYPHRIINIHHSFLPAFVGANPYRQAFDRGVKLIGATSHYVTDVLDDGPIIDQQVDRVTHRDSVEDLVRHGKDLERVVLGRAVRLHLEDRVLVSGRKTIVFA
ncbi:MAG: formyltetrahydrofolate deformylase [Deltaproteobacteria bacterium]|nr:formyltetrahydrofolate deformylase [Deltaproteobacteria bacterium]